jgi:O-antigen/teichoic acid export membrane protein
MLSRILKDTGVAGLGEIFFISVTYATTFLISRSLGAEGVGIYAQAMLVTTFVSLLARLGLDVGVLRFIPLYLVKKDGGYVRGVMLTASGLVLVTSLALGGGVFVAADLLANLVFKEPRLTPVLRVFALAIPLLALSAVWLNGIQAFKRTDYRVYISKIVAPLVSLTTLGVFFGLGLYWNGVLVSTVLTALVGAGLAYFVYYRLQGTILSTKDEEPKFATREWLVFSYPLFFSRLLAFASARATILMLGYFQTSADVGVYEIASRVAFLIQMPLDISSFIFAPIIGEMYAKGDRTRLQELFQTVTKWIFAVSLLIFLMVVLLAQPILAFFGPEFVIGVSVLYILAIGHLINVSTGAVGWMLIMSGHSKVHLFNYVLLVLLTLVLSLYLIPSYGIIGAAIVVAVAEVVVNVVRLVEVFYLLKIHPYRWDFLKPIMAGLMTLGVVYLLQRQITHFAYPVLWTSLFVAGSILTLYITFSALLHWSEVKTVRF